MEVDGSTLNDMKIFNTIRRHIKRKISNCDNDFYGDCFKAEAHEIMELMQRSVEAGESNSAILCGSPGCGKTALVNNVISELKKSGVFTEENSVVVRLNGLIHTDDRITLQDIARQLKLADFTEETAKSKSFQENLAFLMEQLQLSNTQKPCVIFILDEFHLFAEHKNQLLLYNLFDTAQSAKSPICVLGLTYYSDVMDLLEKRVLSRFSHRVIQMARSVTVEDRLAVLKDIFTLTSEALPSVDEIYSFVWNSKTDELVESLAVKRAIQRHLDLDPSEARFRNLLFKLFNTITFEEPLISVQSIVEVFTPKDDQILVISKLSALEVALIVAVKNHTINYEREPFNFEMILTQYLKFVKQHASTMVSERAVILKAFQRIQELELVVPLKRAVGNGMGKVPIEYQLYTFNLTEDQVKEGVKLNKSISADLTQWGLQLAPS